MRHWWKTLCEGTASAVVDTDEVISSLTVLGTYFCLIESGDLRETMKHTGALISGSAVLQRITGDDWVPKDLDFYVSKYADFEALRSFLACNGYLSVMEDVVNVSSVYTSGLIQNVETFHHSTSRRVIQVIYSSNYSAFAPILAFDSTLLMNYIGADRIVCVYPDLTINRIGLRLSKKKRALPFFAKYAARGFKMMAQVASERESPIYSVTKITDPSVLSAPEFPLFSSTDYGSWVLPFQAVHTANCSAGLWFQVVEDYREF